MVNDQHGTFLCFHTSRIDQGSGKTSRFYQESNMQIQHLEGNVFKTREVAQEDGLEAMRGMD